MIRRGRTAVLPPLLLALVALPTHPLGAQDLDSLVTARLGTLASGTVAGAYHEEELVLMRTWGASSFDATEGDTLRADALFPFPAFTEVLVASTVRALHSSGVLDVHEPVRRYLPDLAEPLGRVTLDDLLRHTGGLDDAAAPADATLEEVVDSLPPGAAFTDPGVIYSHSRYSYPLAVRVLERATGMTLADLAATALFRPLGMSRSTFDRTEAEGRGLAEGYRADPGDAATAVRAEPVERIDGLPVLYTSVPEILQFLVAWMGGAVGGGPAALPGEPPRAPVDQYLADGFWHDRYQLLLELQRTSRGLGHTVTVRAYPDTRTAVAVWTNTEGRTGEMTIDPTGAAGLPGHVADLVTERLLGGDIPVTVTEELPDTTAVSSGADRLPLWAWAGRYVNGDRQIILRTPQTEGSTDDLAFFDGDRELPLERLEDGSVLARLPDDRSPAFRFWLVRDDAGRKYLLYGGRAYRLVEE